MTRREEWRSYERVKRGDVRGELSDELAFHVAMRAEALESQGYDAQTAVREAERRLGDIDRLRTQCEQEGERMWRRRHFSEVVVMTLRDLVIAARGIRRRRAFAIASCVTLALGIGATASVYSMVDAVMFAPLPYDRADQLVMVTGVRTTDANSHGISMNVLDTWSGRAKTVGPFARYIDHSRILSDAGDPEEIQVMSAENNLFAVLGARPLIGSLFTEANRPNGGSENAVVLSAKLWRRHFGSDPGVIGREVKLQEKPFRVIGVMPPEFEFPVGSNIEAWTPLVYDETLAAMRDFPMYNAITRLRGTATPAVAEAELEPDLKRALAQSSDFSAETDLWRVRVTPAKEAMLGSDRALVLMLGAVTLLLLIACANVANLFLVRASGRRLELVVRAALGGRRIDLAAPLLLEALMICVAAAVLGLVLARVATVAIVAWDPGGIARWQAIHLSVRAWLVASGATLLAGLLCAVAPALIGSRVAAADAVRSDARASDSHRRLRLRDAIVAFEVALVFVLLVGAGLLLRSFAAVRAVDSGFSVDHVLTARVVLPSERYGKRETKMQFYDDVLARLRATPGVSSAAGVSVAPLSTIGTALRNEYVSPVTGAKITDAQLRFATPGYFRTLAIPLRGRDFGPQDTGTSEQVVILNQTLARLLFPGVDPMGRQVHLGRKTMTVIGVAGDVHSAGLEQPVIPESFHPHTQFQFLPGLIFVARTVGDPDALGVKLKQVVHDVDPNMPVANIQSMETNLTHTLARRRFDLYMLGSISLLALGLAAVGIFAVMAHAVSQRRQEFGIRQAIGATSSQIVELVVRHTFRLLVVSIVVGAGFALLFANALRAVLFGVEPVDPVTIALAAACIALVGVAAAAIPAIAAARVDPLEVLRN